MGELRKFTGKHPAIIQDWLESEAEKDFTHNPEYKITLKDRKHRIRFWLLESLGIDIGIFDDNGKDFIVNGRIESLDKLLGTGTSNFSRYAAPCGLAELYLLSGTL